MNIAALYVETDGCYFGLSGVDPWDESRDARKAWGIGPAVAHPPCQRWGKFWHGSTRKPHQFELGADGGCFAAAHDYVRKHGGIIEHPADSHAWAAFGIIKPPRSGGWVPSGDGGGTCCVYQGHYGHPAGKATWLVVYGVHRSRLPELCWGKTEQRIHPRALELYGYEKARRVGIMAMMGGKNKTRDRNATPPQFRDELVAIARLVWGAE